MSKIYEALQNAQAQRKEITDASVELADTSIITRDEERAVDVPMVVPRLRMEAEMLMLYHGIDSLLPGFDKMAIQFIGSHAGEGTSTIVREFAHTAASKMGKSVLVMDTDHADSTLASYGVSDNAYREEMPSADGCPGHYVHHTQHQNVFLSPVTGSIEAFMKRFEGAPEDNLLEQLKVKYDLILIDSPPASENPVGFAFCRRVDGVVLVVEAGKTRWPVVEALKNRVLGCGGRILGIALNKRKYDIPDFVYSRL